mmetsp:Transcript_41801/g.126791  ORF Transcript_41801/g.126791 Transcript_41801/m.126791 type:complete len:561 (-) Transcript_41801:28-1710(-)
MSRRSRSRRLYMDALDEGDVVIRATEETFEQWERCRSSASTADCSVPTGDVIAEKTAERDQVDSEFSRPYSREAKSPFGVLGVDYIRVTSMGDLDQGTGSVATNTSDRRLMIHIAVSFLAIFSWLCIWIRSKRKCNNSLPKVEWSEHDETRRDGRQEEIVCRVSGDSISGSNKTSCQSATPESRRNIQYCDQYPAHMSPLLIDEVKEERELSLCPATAPPSFGEAIRFVEEEAKGDDTINMITPRNRPFTPQRTPTSNNDSLSNVHTMTLPPKNQCTQIVSSMSERFGIKKEDAGKIVAKEYLKAQLKGVQKMLEFDDEVRQKREAKVLAAKEELQGLAWSIFLGRRFVRCMGLSLAACIVYPVIQKVWESKTEPNGVRLALDIFAADVCGCSSPEQTHNQASSSLFSSLIPSGDYYFSSYFPEMRLMWCYLWALSFPFILAVVHWIISFIHANKSAHNVLNLAACCCVLMRLASKDSTQSSSSFVFELITGMATFHAILAGMLLILAQSKGTQKRVMRLIACDENHAEAETHLFSIASYVAEIVSLAFAVWNGVVAVSN